MSYRQLADIVQSRPQGPKSFFSVVHLIRYLELVESRHFSRKDLTKRLKLGEGSVRTMTKLLRSEGLVEVVRAGARLSEKGRAFLASLRQEFSKGIVVPGDKAVVDVCNVAIVVRGGGSRVSSGVEQRDAAIFAGSRGASTFVYSSGKLVFPGMCEDLSALDPRLSEAITGQFDLREGDAVIVGSAPDQDAAFIGAIAAAATLL